MSASEFGNAGLNKLTPAELDNLNKWIVAHATLLDRQAATTAVHEQGRVEGVIYLTPQHEGNAFAACNGPLVITTLALNWKPSAGPCGGYDDLMVPWESIGGVEIQRPLNSAFSDGAYLWVIYRDSTKAKPHFLRFFGTDALKMLRLRAAIAAHPAVELICVYRDSDPCPANY